MKRVSRWLAGICMAAVLLGAAGLEAVPVRAADPVLEITCLLYTSPSPRDI